MSNTLFDYDQSMVNQHIDELRRDAAKARLARASRRSRRQRRQATAAHRALHAVPAR